MWKKNYKTFKENPRENQQEVGSEDKLLNTAPKVWCIKQQATKQARDWGRVYATHPTAKGLGLTVCKEFFKLKRKKKNLT